MKQKKNFKGLIFVCILCASFLCTLLINFNVKKGEEIDLVSAYACAPETETLDCATPEASLQPVDEIDSGALDVSFLGYKSYKKGDTNVNILLNFVNYKNDYVNHFTSQEIADITSTCKKDLNNYFSIMSQGFLTIDLDYIVTTSSTSYEEYKAKENANIITESWLFANSVIDKKDENGNKKTLNFKNYNVCVNFFAGDPGEWSTFLWPHAFYDISLITMIEGRGGHSSTLCHELMHTFGVKDLYSYTGGSQLFSAQCYDMMASSSFNNGVNAHFREKVGWLEESEYHDDKITSIETLPISYKGSMELYLSPRCTEDKGNIIAYKFGENKDKKEYFVMEYRVKNYAVKGTTFDNESPQSGIIIYRVNESVEGNMDGNESGSYNEVIFMGNSTYDVSTYDYTYSCAITEGNSYGSKSLKPTKTSLVYSGGGGKENLFTGENSDIVIAVNKLTDDYAIITITFKEQATGNEVINLSGVAWNCAESTAFNYNSDIYSANLINLPSQVKVVYCGVQSTKNAGYHTVSAFLVYDASRYQIKNNVFATTRRWRINPVKISIKADDIVAKYGDDLPLTFSVTSGTLYDGDNLNVSLAIDGEGDVGTYIINCSASNENYKITTENGVCQIIPRTIRIKLLDQKYYVDEFNAIDQSKFEILSNGDTIVDGDMYVINVLAEGLEEAEKGKYKITAVCNNSNYELVVDSTGILELKEKTNWEKLRVDFLKILTLLCVSVVSLFAVGATIYISSKVKKRLREQKNWDDDLFDDL